MFILHVFAESGAKFEGVAVPHHGKIVLEREEVLLVGPRSDGPNTGKVLRALEPYARALVAIFLSRKREEIRNGGVQLLLQRHVRRTDGDLVLGPTELEVVDHGRAESLAQLANGNLPGLLPGFVNHP